MKGTTQSLSSGWLSILAGGWGGDTGSHGMGSRTNEDAVTSLVQNKGLPVYLLCFGHWPDLGKREASGNSVASFAQLEVCKHPSFHTAPPDAMHPACLDHTCASQPGSPREVSPDTSRVCDHLLFSLVSRMFYPWENWEKNPSNCFLEILVLSHSPSWDVHPLLLGYLPP